MSAKMNSPPSRTEEGEHEKPFIVTATVAPTVIIVAATVTAAVTIVIATVAATVIIVTATVSSLPPPPPCSVIMALVACFFPVLGSSSMSNVNLMPVAMWLWKIK